MQVALGGKAQASGIAIGLVAGFPVLPDGVAQLQGAVGALEVLHHVSAQTGEGTLVQALIRGDDPGEHTQLGGELEHHPAERRFASGDDALESLEQGFSQKIGGVVGVDVANVKADCLLNELGLAAAIVILEVPDD